MDNEEIQSIDSPEINEISASSESSSISPHREALNDLLGGRAYHFIDGIANAKALLGGLNSKIDSLKSKSEIMESNEVLGIMSDFANQSDMLNSEFERIDNFFDNSLSQKELNFINKLKLINDSLSEAMQRLDSIELEKALKDISDSVEQSSDIRVELKQFFTDLTSLIKNVDENTKKKISTQLSAINTLEEEFCQKHNENMNKFLDSQIKNFQLQTNTQDEAFKKQIDKQKEQLDSLLIHLNTIKKSVVAFVFAAVFIGFLCGAFSLLAFSKYSEYKEVETKFNALSEKLNGVKMLKNSNNDIMLLVPKSATIKSDGKEHIINLGGGK